GRRARRRCAAAAPRDRELRRAPPPSRPASARGAPWGPLGVGGGARGRGRPGGRGESGTPANDLRGLFPPPREPSPPSRGVARPVRKAVRPLRDGVTAPRGR